MIYYIEKRKARHQRLRSHCKMFRVLKYPKTKSISLSLDIGDIYRDFPAKYHQSRERHLMHLFTMLLISNQDSSLTSINNQPKDMNDKALILQNRNKGLRDN